VSVIVKSLLRKNAPMLQGHEDASMMALVAISRRHPGIYEARMRDELPKIGPTLDDTTVTNVFPLMNTEPSTTPLTSTNDRPDRFVRRV
jgi:hypothetical protein